MPESVQLPTPQSTNWKKIGLTILIIIIVTGLIAGVYWVFVLNKSSDISDLTGPVPKPNVTTATASATSSTQKDETSVWEIYTSNELGISVKHPKDFKFINETTGITDKKTSSVTLSKFKDITADNALFISISKPNLFRAAYEALLKLKVGTPVSRYVAESPNVAIETRLSNITLDGIVAIRRTYVPTQKGVGIVRFSLDVYVKKNNEYYKISLLSDTEKDFESNKKVFDLILSTFKFLD